MTEKDSHETDGAFRPRGAGALALLFVRGLTMGTVDLVPGVSGGTLALVMGIYYELVASLRALSSRGFLQALGQGRLKAAFRAVNGAFLLTLALGMLSAILALSPVMTWLLSEKPVFVSAFFFGLVAATVIVVSRRVRPWSPVHSVLFAAGAVCAFVLVGLSPAVTPDAWWFLLLSGALAVSAFMMPGVSGAFVLVLLGKYEFALAALVQRDVSSVLLLVLGGLIGMLTLARVLTWLFRRWHAPTLALLAGVVLGSLRKVWPWQEERGGLSVSLMPDVGAFDPAGGYGFAILLAAAGFAAVVLLDGLAGRRKPSAHDL